MSEEKEEQVEEFEAPEEVVEAPEEIKPEPAVDPGVYQCPKPKDRSVEPLEFAFREGDNLEINGFQFEVESRSGEKLVLKRVDFK